LPAKPQEWLPDTTLEIPLSDGISLPNRSDTIAAAPILPGAAVFIFAMGLYPETGSGDLIVAGIGFRYRPESARQEEMPQPPSGS
jgi:hypothetical protein